MYTPTRVQFGITTIIIPPEYKIYFTLSAVILWLVSYFGGREDHFDDRSGFGDHMFW